MSFFFPFVCPFALGPLDFAPLEFVHVSYAKCLGMLFNARSISRWEASAGVLERGGSVSKEAFAILG